MKKVFLLLAAFAAVFAFTEGVEASHNDHESNTYNINVYVDGENNKARNHRSNSRYNRYGHVSAHKPYVSHVGGYGYTQSLPSSYAYKSYTPYTPSYNTYGKRYGTDNFYKTNGSKYSDAYHAYNRSNNTYVYGNSYSTFNRVDQKKQYVPHKERYSGTHCSGH